MNKMDRCEIAKKYFYDGYNCSQSIVLAFSDLVNVNKEILLKIASSYGGGIGRLRETCGAFTGCIIIIGLLYGYSTPETGEIKKEHYSRVQEIANDFKEVYNTLSCKELLNLNGPDSPIPTPRTNEFYLNRPCPNIIYTAAKILDDYIKKNPFNR